MVALAAPLGLAGCSLSSKSALEAPMVTGSIGQPVEVQRPLPPSLAYSDAAKIGEAARAALMQATGEAPDDWINERTGSSGSIETADASRSGECRSFSTMVTSIGGVHHYSGELCGAASPRPFLRIDERDPGDR